MKATRMKKSEILAALKDARDCLHQSEQDLLWRRLDIFDALVEGGEGVSADYAAKMIADYTTALLGANRLRREIQSLMDEFPTRPFPSPVPECPDGADYMSHLSACNCD